MQDSFLARRRTATSRPRGTSLVSLTLALALIAVPAAARIVRAEDAPGDEVVGGTDVQHGARHDASPPWCARRCRMSTVLSP